MLKAIAIVAGATTVAVVLSAEGAKRSKLDGASVKLLGAVTHDVSHDVIEVPLPL